MIYFDVQEQKLTKNLSFLFFFIVFVNILLKFFFIDFSSLWYDEAVSIKAALEDFGHVKHVSDWDKNPPFYYYCLWVWIRLFGDTVFSVRLLSVFFSSLAAGVLFLFSNKKFNYKTAIYVSVFYLFNHILFFYSHETRAYSLTVLLAILSVHVYFICLENPKWFNFFLLGLINFLLIYTHYVSGLVMFFEAVYVLLFERKKIKYFLFSALVISVFVSLRFTKKQIQLILDFNSSKNDFWLQKSEFSYFKEVLLSFFSSNYFLSIIFIVLYFVAIFWLLFKKEELNKRIIVFTIGLSSGTLLVLFLLGFFTPIFLDRYILFSVPFFLVPIAYFLSQFKLQFLSIIIVFAISLFSLYTLSFKTDKPMDYKSAVPLSLKLRDSNSLIIVTKQDVASLYCYYYNVEYFNEKNFLEKLKKEHIISVNTTDELNIDINQYKKIILVSSFSEYSTKEKSIVDFLDHHFNKILDFKGFQGVNVRTYYPVVKQR